MNSRARANGRVYTAARDLIAIATVLEFNLENFQFNGLNVASEGYLIKWTVKTKCGKVVV